MPDAGEHHGDAGVVGGLDDFVVADRAAGLDHRGSAGFDSDQQPIGAYSAAFLTFFALITEVGAPRATVITYVNPAVALALGVALLGEPFTVGIAIGFVFIVLGSVLATRRTPPPSSSIRS